MSSMRSRGQRPQAPGAGPKQRARAGLHPRNRHQGHYDFAALVAVCPALSDFVIRNPAAEQTIDFSDPAAVRMLNRALLHSQYGIAHWDLPAGYLCPPVPGRADYVHALADLLAADRGGVIPRGPALRVLDIGTGASCIYPLIGLSEYGWQFVGSDLDDGALAAAQRTLTRNPGLAAHIELRRQPKADQIYAGVLAAGEHFAVSLCNPPFHTSAAEAMAGSARKWANLGKAAGGPSSAVARNFGGRGRELWCQGGELRFVGQMIAESAASPAAVGWYSSLISRSAHLDDLRHQLQQVGAREVQTIAMGQGQKQSRFLAWSFLERAQRIAASSSRAAIAGGSRSMLSS